MKIHEIISEAGVLQSIGTNVLKGLASLVGRGATWRTAEEYAPEIAKKASQLGRKLSDDEVAKVVKNSSESVQEALEKALERKMARDPRATRLTRAEQDAVISDHPNPDPKLIKEIQKQAGKLVDDAEWNVAVKPFKDLGKVGSKVWLTGLVGLKAWGVYELWVPPLKDYWENMDTAKSYLDSGKWTEANYRNEENKQLSTLIGRLGMGLVTVGVAGLLNNRLTRAALGKMAGGVLDLSTTGAVIYLRTKLNEDYWADGIAAFMMNDYIAGNATVLGQAIPGIGSLAAEAKRKLIGDIKATQVVASDKKDNPAADKPAGDATQSTKPAEKKPEADATQTTPADTAAPKVDPNATPIDKWISLGGGYIKDPKTGEIKRSVARQFQ